MVSNPLKITVLGGRKVDLAEFYGSFAAQVGTPQDHQNLNPDVIPPQRFEAPEELTDANTYFISNAMGDDSNPGTEALPKKSLWKISRDKPYYCLLDDFCYISYDHLFTSSFESRIKIYNDTGVNATVRFAARDYTSLDYGPSELGNINDTTAIFVDFKNGNDSNNGSEVSGGAGVGPVKTVQKAVDLAIAAAKEIVIVKVDETYTNEEATSEENVEVLLSAQNLHMLPAKRYGSGDMEWDVGFTARIKYETVARESSSPQRYWESFFYEPGRFQQAAGVDTIYCGCREGTTPRIYYSMDGINWSVVNTNPFPARVFNFCWIEYAAQDYMFCGTDSGVYRSNDGLNWIATTLTSGGYYVYTWNNNVVTTGPGGVKRSDSIGTAWTTIDVSAGYVEMVELGEYLYYANNANSIKRMDSSWNVNTFATITEMTLVKNIVTFKGCLYAGGWNSSSNTWYFIKLNTSGDYEIIHSESYTGNDNLKYMLTVDDRIYINKVFSGDGLVAYDGTRFFQVCSLQNDCYYMHYGFKNRLYYSLYNQNQRVKYAILDNISVVNSTGTSELTLEGIVLNGNQKRARSLIVSEKTIQLNLHLYYNQLHSAFYSGIKLGTQSYLYSKYNIFHQLKNGIISSNVTLAFCLFYDLLEVGARCPSPSLKIEYCTFDLVNTVGKEWYGFEHCIVTRCASLIENNSIICAVSNSVINHPILDTNCEYTDIIWGDAIFRNRDGIEQDFPDYRLQAKWIHPPNDPDSYYRFNSPGISPWYNFEYAKDYGAYGLVRTKIADEWKYQWECDFNPAKSMFDIRFNNFNELVSVSGIRSFSHKGEQMAISIPWQPKTREEFLTIHTLFAMIRSDHKMRLFANFDRTAALSDLMTLAQTGDIGFFSGPAANTSGVWEAKFTKNPLILKQRQTNWFDNEFRGYHVQILYIQEGINSRLFKVIRNDENTLYLENTEEMSEIHSVLTDIDDSLVFIVQSIDVKINAKELHSLYSYWIRKTPIPQGAMNIQFLEAP